MAATAPLPDASQDLHDALQLSLLRAFFGSVAGVCLAGAVAMPLLATQLSVAARLLMLLCYATLGLGAAWATRLPVARAGRMLPAVVLGGILLVGGVAALTGWGLQTPGLLFFGMTLCMANAVMAGRVGLSTTALALAVVLGLGAAEKLGWLPAPADGPGFGPRLVAHGVVIVTASLVGRAIDRLLRRHMTMADAREQRFRALLGIAASGYWETDAELRLTLASRRVASGRFLPVARAIGQRPWELEAVQMTGETVVQLRAAMQARAPLRDLGLSWRRADGAPLHVLIDGEPRLAPDGSFLGYWGVARDVTAEQRARQAQAATENRYRDLFDNLPTSLVLHRRGRVIEANRAAALLLGYDQPHEMLGLDLLATHVVAADQPAAHARLDDAEAAATGQALPPISLTLRSRQGREVSVSSIAARTLHLGHPATLSIGIDETERREAAQALQRSQALLASVVAMSPDVIALTELDTGRYVMVNASFTRLLGYEAAEVVGRTARELRLWRSDAERDRLGALFTERGAFKEVLGELVAKDGHLVPLMITGILFQSDGRRYALTNARDLSQSTRARLEREAILANASVGIAFTRHQRFEVVNAHFEQMFGWPPGSLQGQPGRVVWPSDEAYAALGREIGPRLARGEAVDVEHAAMHRDGSPLLMRLRAKAIDPSQPALSGTIWIAEDVTEAHRAAQELARARDAAEAANRAKTAFLANTSHELRTPLNGLTGLARLARQPGLPPQRLRLYLEQIGESADLLTAIISDILDLSKIEAGKLELETAPFHLRQLLHSLQQAYGALAAGNGLAFDVQIEPSLPDWALGDALRVRQVLSNFLHNALKFTAAGRIRLVARALPGDRLRFEVHDTGPGIDAATQARLFKPFTQADESTTRRFGGTGLGLSICRELATLMGGEVGVRSQPGQGSCFHAELRLAAAAAADLPVPAEGARLHRLRGRRVLLVEDNAVNMMIGVALLEDWGLQVEQAVDGAMALARVDQAHAAGRPFDLVLMDLQMPGMSGYEATQALRLRHGAAQLPVIALTAAALLSERERAAAHGMTDFLTKPIDPQLLQAALLRALPPRPATAAPGLLSPA